MPLLSVLALLGAPSAMAQTRVDLEYRDTEVDQEDDRTTVRGFFESHYYEYGNIDLRVLDETSNQSILDSDDRGSLAFTGAQLEVGYQIDPQVRFVFAGSHRGLWGDDQLGSTNVFGTVLYIPALYADLYTKRDNEGVRFRVGRQFYSLGGLGRGVRDYVMADILDMVRIDIPVGSVARLTLVPLNVFSNATRYDNVDFVFLLGQQDQAVSNYRGAILTRRFGATFDLIGEDLPLRGQLYGFFTDLHGRGTGADISYSAILGNFADNDYIANYGLRLHADLGPITPFAELNGSAGIDRKELEARDVDTNGLAWGAGVRVDTRDDAQNGLLLQARYFEAMGARFESDGLQSSHGFVAMKAQQIGGTLFNRFMGVHPSAYAGRNGVSDTPQNINRQSGTRSFELFAAYKFEPGLKLEGGVWFLQDTGSSDVDFTDLDNLEPPPRYSRADFAATRRLGRPLGTELDLDVAWLFGPHVEVFGRGAVILPGSFYSIVIDRSVGTALGSDDPQNPWSIHGGLRVNF